MVKKKIVITREGDTSKRESYERRGFRVQLVQGWFGTYKGKKMFLAREKIALKLAKKQK